ncbi:MAG TPA: hypothetical protein V6D17_00205 [Candidatus Obscuribacterales bacterium]
MRIFLVLAVLVALIGGGGYWYWTTTPQFAVQQAKDAVKKHDLKTFEKYVDLKTVSSEMADDLLKKPVIAMLGEGIFGHIIAATFTGLFKPQFTRQVEDDLRHYVEFGNWGEAQSPLGGVDSKLGVHKHKFKEITGVSTEGSIGQVTVVLENESEANKQLLVIFMMRKVDNHWQIISVKNFPEIIGKLVELKIQDGQQNDMKSSDMPAAPSGRERI